MFSRFLQFQIYRFYFLSSILITVLETPRMISDPDSKNNNNERQKSIEKEISSVVVKEVDWNKLKTNKETTPSHNFQKFKSELLNENSKTIDLGQLKLEINFGQKFIKNQNTSNSPPSFKNDKQKSMTSKSPKSQSYDNHDNESAHNVFFLISLLNNPKGNFFVSKRQS